MPCPQALRNLTGTVIDGNLELVSVLGEGSYGMVYQARVTDAPNQYLAVKCMWRSRRRTPQARLQAKELRNHKAVSKHQGVITLHCQIVTDDFVFIVLDLAETDLYKVIASGRVFCHRPYRVRQAMNSMLNALSYMHRKGVFHRDITPENVLCDRMLNGVDIRFADFGLSTPRAFSSRHGCGSLPYMSPEALDYDHPSARSGYSTISSDLWALAIIFCALVSGDLPWARAHPSDRAYALFLADEDYLLGHHKVPMTAMQSHSQLGSFFFPFPLGSKHSSDAKA
ncbi:Protein kinase domain-containing protein [Mycena indigotica]|uniref:mitogen-activated protein kinase kinase n=1 Tax=Mycena indigotica TaxID=2126181 RepID=A0A8H6W2A8_9AGAR|nr:Protein kinase domain-containing protein [Mycena indigotica]KAF7296769.1 Protein kinase domain-containing protein [Mycena indigotica]